MADLSYQNRTKRIQLLEIYSRSVLSIKDAWGRISDFQLFADAPNCCVRVLLLFTFHSSIKMSLEICSAITYDSNESETTPLKPKSCTRGSDCSCVCMVLYGPRWDLSGYSKVFMFFSKFQVGFS